MRLDPPGYRKAWRAWSGKMPVSSDDPYGYRGRCPTAGHRTRYLGASLVDSVACRIDSYRQTVYAERVHRPILEKGLVLLIGNQQARVINNLDG